MTEIDYETAAAEMAFGELRERPTPELIFRLDDKDRVTRMAAAMVLQRRGERAAFERGVELCRSEDAAGRETGAFLLRLLGYDSGYPFRDASVPVLVALLRDGAAAVRMNAAMGLGQFHAATAFDALVRLAGDPDPRVRGEVAVALGRLGREEAAAVIERLRGDRDAHVAERAEVGLEFLYRDRFGYEMATNLCNKLADPDLDFAARMSAAELLSEHDREAAFRNAAVLLASGAETVRTGGILLLEQLGWPEDPPHRREILALLEAAASDDPSGDLRRRAASTLGRIGAG
jgi:HEAT repeat protein